MYAFSTTAPTTTIDPWNDGSYGGTSSAYYAPALTVVVSQGVSYGLGAPPPETPLESFVRKSKAERAREQMRAYLARFPRQDVSEPAPACAPRVAADPLRHHRSQGARRTPRLSWLRRAA